MLIGVSAMFASSKQVAPMHDSRPLIVATPISLAF
jgi:hypothetical protein